MILCLIIPTVSKLYIRNTVRIVLTGLIAANERCTIPAILLILRSEKKPSNTRS